MSSHINEIELTIFDTETTGLDPLAGERIVEIAGIRLKGEKEISVFSSFLNPGRPVSEAAFAVNKITPAMLEGAPPPEKIIPDFLKFSQGSFLCSYNAGFDLGFLNNELKLLGLPVLKGEPVFDVLIMARKLLPGFERYALWFVAEKLGIKNEQEHRALSDVKLTLAVFNKLKEASLKKGMGDFAIFSRLFTYAPAPDDTLSQKVASIRKAIDLKARLKIKYLSVNNAEVSQREIIPKEVREDFKYKYLVGHCCLKNGERTFRVDNILSLEIIA